MAEYYTTRPAHTPPQPNSVGAGEAPQARILSEFDKFRETLLTDDVEEGWASELRRYLGTMQRDVTKESDLVEWWQVQISPTIILFFY